MSKVLYKNVFYMLSYVFDVLKQNSYRHIGEDSELDNLYDLYAELLISSFRKQQKRGLNKGYLQVNDETLSPKGKILTTQSIKSNSLLNNRIWCQHDEFLIDTRFNQIIKAAMIKLKQNPQVADNRKSQIQKLIVYLAEVTTINANCINWNLSFNRNNKTYDFILFLCKMIITGSFLNEDKNNEKFNSYFDNCMSSIFEKFIYKYYKDTLANARVEYQKQVKWALPTNLENYNLQKGQLPDMHTDTYITKGDKILIIDTKYYKQSMQENYSVKKIRSDNLYQIFTYVINESFYTNHNQKVSGLLLYAKTDEAETPNIDKEIANHLISAHTVDLNKKWDVICNELEQFSSMFL